MSSRPHSTANLNRNGRPRGARNRATVAREAAARAAVAAVTENLAPETIAKMSPLEVLLAVMGAQLAAGDLMGAASVAEKAAPYMHAKKSSAPGDLVLPPDLLPPETDATPDEPVPANPIL